jgi:putative ABC transport system substrate-binding protein
VSEPPRLARRLWLLAAASLTFAVRAQPPAHRIAFFYFGGRAAARAPGGRFEAFVQALRQLGYTPGADLRIDERYADGKAERVAALAAEVIALAPEVIVASGSPTYDALKLAATAIPVVVTVTVDPVAAGLAKTLAHPGGTFTGLTDTAEFLGPKLLELLAEARPGLQVVAVLANPSNESHPWQLQTLGQAAQRIGVKSLRIDAQTPTQLESAFVAMRAAKVQALIILGDTFFADQMGTIAKLALRERLPAAYGFQYFAGLGGFIAYGPDSTNNFRRAAVYVDNLLKGAKPGDLPFEQPIEYKLVVNLRTATALGLELPGRFLLRVDQTIN